MSAMFLATGGREGTASAKGGEGGGRGECGAKTGRKNSVRARTDLDAEATEADKEDLARLEPLECVLAERANEPRELILKVQLRALV